MAVGADSSGVPDGGEGKVTTGRESNSVAEKGLRGRFGGVEEEETSRPRVYNRLPRTSDKPRRPRVAYEWRSVRPKPIDHVLHITVTL
jgi:hypothetical protein